MKWQSKGDPIIVRVLGAICALGAIVGLAAGLSNRHVQSGRQMTILAVIAGYVLLSSVGTILLRKVFAGLLAVPLAVLGAVTVVMSIIQGPWVAVIMNCLITAPLLAIPLLVVYRNWRCLS